MRIYGGEVKVYGSRGRTVCFDQAGKDVMLTEIFTSQLPPEKEKQPVVALLMSQVLEHHGKRRTHIDKNGIQPQIYIPYLPTLNIIHEHKDDDPAHHVIFAVWASESELRRLTKWQQQYNGEVG